MLSTYQGLIPDKNYEFDPKDIDKGEYYSIINAKLKSKNCITPLTIILGYIFDKLFTKKAVEMKRNINHLYTFCKKNRKRFDWYI